MGKILSAYLFPHPPIIVKEVGKGEEYKAKKTLEASKKLARDIRNRQPTTIILVTPHGPLFKDAMAISVKDELKGNFSNFGAANLKLKFKNNGELVRRIMELSREDGINLLKIDEALGRQYNISTELDHGTLVPLYFVDKEYKNFKLVHISYGLLSPENLYSFGKIIQKASLEIGERAVFIASGDLSHRLSHDGPYEYSPYGEEYDRKIVAILRKGDMDSIRSFDLDLSERAGECGIRSLMVMAGFLDGLKIEAELLSYEGPFGIGYCNASFSTINESRHVKLARSSLESYVKYKERIDLPEDLPKEFLNSRHGVFVTIKKEGRLRGCIGTIGPVQENLAREIIENAISAGTRDPRFEAVNEEELPQLEYSVDILMPPETIDSLEELDVEKYGLIVSKGHRRGLLLPNLEGVDSPEIQVKIALEKGGILEDEDYKLERFKVIRHY